MRVGFEVIMDFVFFVIRNMEDFVIWIDILKIRKYVLEYSDFRDDFDFL